MEIERVHCVICDYFILLSIMANCLFIIVVNKYSFIAYSYYIIFYVRLPKYGTSITRHTFIQKPRYLFISNLYNENYNTLNMYTAVQPCLKR